jgi:hypothetical protein
MRTSQLIADVGGRAGGHFVCAELSKRGITNALLPENFPEDEIVLSSKESRTKSGYIQVKVCHPDQSEAFMLRETEARWGAEASNKFCVFVWLGATWNNEPPRYWIARKREVGDLCVAHSAKGISNWERRFKPADFPQNWENRWSLFDVYRPLNAMLQDA